VNTIFQENFEVIPVMQNVDLKGLKRRYPSFRVGMCCSAPTQKDDGYPFYIQLRDNERDEVEVNVAMDLPIPPGHVPQFLVHSDCIKYFDQDWEELWPDLVSNALAKFSEARVVLARQRKTLFVTVLIGAFNAKGKVSIDKVRKFFE
jgi:hypothetical protein